MILTALIFVHFKFKNQVLLLLKSSLMWNTVLKVSNDDFFVNFGTYKSQIYLSYVHVRSLPISRFSKIKMARTWGWVQLSTVQSLISHHFFPASGGITKTGNPLCSITCLLTLPRSARANLPKPRVPMRMRLTCSRCA